MLRGDHQTWLDDRVHELDECFRAVIDLSKPVALIDFPNHNNCGDSAIWLGERRALTRLGARVLSVSDQASFVDADLEGLAGGGTLLIHGGGNFGSIWPEEQAFRERIVTSHPELPIVQLPQTLHFEDDDSLASARRALGGHPNLVVLTRDTSSLTIARERLALEARLCPDAASGLGRLDAPRSSRVPIVWMARSDGEGFIAPPKHAPDVEVVDWLRGNPYRPLSAQTASVTVRARGLLARTQRVDAVRRLTERSRARAFDWLARRRLTRGLDILSYGDVVVTDRLHGHILCCLLGKRHVVLDTRHGKVSAYMESFPPPEGLAHPARSTDEALRLARGLAEEV